MEKTDQTLKAAQRPWVSVGPVQPVSGFEYTDSGANLTVAFGLSNYGHSPALNVEIDGEMRIFPPFPASGINIKTLNRQNVICDQLRTRPVGNSGNGITVVPNVPAVNIRVLFSTIKKDIYNGTLYFPNMPVIPNIFLIGCVRYVSFADFSQHDTGFVYQVDSTNGLLPADQGNIPAKQIVLVQPVFGSGRTH